MKRTLLTITAPAKEKGRVFVVHDDCDVREMRRVLFAVIGPDCDWEVDDDTNEDLFARGVESI